MAETKQEINVEKTKSSLNDDFIENKNKLKEKELKKLNEMSNNETDLINKKKQLNELTIEEIYQNCLISMKSFINEFDYSNISYDYVVEFLNTNNRKFYCGIFLCVFGLILYIFDTLLI